MGPIDGEAGTARQRPSAVATTVRLTVNGRPVEGVVEARRSLADFLREDLRLTGTHVGCEHGVCGACTVLLDGQSVRACLLLAVQCEGATVTTIEGLTPEAGLSPLQAAFRDCHALQCGFCTPGMIVTAHELLAADPRPSRDRIREAIAANLCMCTGYVNIVRAIERASRHDLGACGAGGSTRGRHPLHVNDPAVRPPRYGR